MITVGQCLLRNGGSNLSDVGLSVFTPRFVCCFGVVVSVLLVLWVGL